MSKLLLILLLCLPILGIAQSSNLNFDFLAKTNIPGVKILGNLKDAQKIKLEKGYQIKIPVKSLVTGLEIRDEHMWRKVFQNKDMKITIEDLSCTKSQKTCSFNLKVKIAETSQNIKLELTNNDGNLSGKFNILLSDFKIPEQSELGVRVKDEVVVNVSIEELE